MRMQYILLILLLNLSNIIFAQECIPIEEVKSRTTTAQSITQSGEYCLKHDLKSPRLFFLFDERRSTGEEILRIDASNVVVDLKGFALEADTLYLDGIGTGWNKPLYTNITIRNGTLKVRTRYGIDFSTPKGSILSDFKREDPKRDASSKESFGVDYAEQDLQKVLKALPQNANAYQKTEYVIEHMKVLAYTAGRDYVWRASKAIGMKGASNIIRNSIIEIPGGHAAIYLFGPNQIIENNIIIFKGKAAVESAAAIKLHHGDNSIIRNNDIIIESSDSDAPKAAISLVNSKDVVVEGNRIYGIKTLIHNWDDQSSSTEKNNDFRSLFRAPSTRGKAGVQ